MLRWIIFLAFTPIHPHLGSRQRCNPGTGATHQQWGTQQRCKILTCYLYVSLPSQVLTFCNIQAVREWHLTYLAGEGVTDTSKRAFSLHILAILFVVRQCTISMTLALDCASYPFGRWQTSFREISLTSCCVDSINFKSSWGEYSQWTIKQQ